MRRLLAILVLGAAVSGCGGHAHVARPTGCTPPAGGRCAGDVSWHGPIELSADGHRLHGVVPCGGTLHATENGGTVAIRLHLGAVGRGEMLCALVDVGIRIPEPLGHRTVIDEVSGHTVRVVRR
jgi:hypothetical protein